MDPAWHHFRPQKPAFSSQGERLQPEMTLSDETLPSVSSTQPCHCSKHNGPHENTNPITEQSATGRPELLRRYPALPSAHSITQPYVAV